jgi:hypothetical protein
LERKVIKTAYGCCKRVKYAERIQNGEEYDAHQEDGTSGHENSGWECTSELRKLLVLGLLVLVRHRLTC